MDRMPPPAPHPTKTSQTSHSGSASGGSVSSLLSTASTDMSGNRSKGSQKSRGGKTRSRIFYFWTSEDVNKWLKKHHGQYYQLYGNLFMEHDISGRTLVRLTDIKLQSIGISDPQHRDDLMRQIIKLKLKVETQELKNMTHKGMPL